MSSVKLGLARAATLVGAVLFWVWLVAKGLVTAIGATTVGDDFDQLLERLPKWADWLFSTPWWVPGSLALCLTIFLVWLSWPSGRAPATKRDEHAPSPPPKETSAVIRLFLRTNEEPSEIYKRNIWRWFVYKIGSIETNGTRKILATHVFIIFEDEFAHLYRRITIAPSSSIVQVLDATNRSAIIVLDGDIENVTLDAVFSNTPV